MVLAATGGSPRHGTILDYAMCPVFSYLRARFMPTTVFGLPRTGDCTRVTGCSPSARAAVVPSWPKHCRRQRSGIAHPETGQYQFQRPSSEQDNEAA